MIVIDASCVIELVVDGSTSESIRSRLEEDWDLVAPHILDIEVASVLRRMEAAGRLDETAASLALLALENLPLERFGQIALLDRIWELRSHIQIADASYVALAEALGAPLLTLDERLARAHGLRCTVEVPE